MTLTDPSMLTKGKSTPKTNNNERVLHQHIIVIKVRLYGIKQ